MAVSAHPPDVAISGPDSRNRSGTVTSTSTSSSSRRESLSSARTNSDSSVPVPSSYSRRTHVHEHDRPPSYLEEQKEGEEKTESLDEEQRQQIISKRDYAIEISKIMGKQLVSTLKMKGHHFDSARSER